MSDIKAKEALRNYNGFGVRHIQMACMSFSILTLFIVRSCMSVGVLAMTDEKRRNDTNVEIYDWNKQTQSLILSSFFWGYTVMQVPGGMLARRFGGKPTVLVALLANSTLCLLLPTFANIGGWMMVCVSRVAMGLTQACLFPSTHTMLGRWLPKQERTTYTGFVYAGSQLGIIATMPLSGVLAETAMGWKLIFYAISGLGFATAIVWFFFAASAPDSHRLISEEEKYYIEKEINISGVQSSLCTPWTHILKSKAFWAIMMAQLSSTVSYVLFFADLPTYLEKGLGISLKNSALLSSLPFAGMWIAAVLSSLISDWITNKGLLSILTCRKIFSSFAMFGTAMSLVALSFLGPETASLALVSVIAALVMGGCVTAGCIVNILDLTPNYGGVLLGMSNTASGFGSLCTPLITAWVLQNNPTDISRWHILFLGFVALNIICNIVYLIFASAERQAWDDPHFLDVASAKTGELKPLNQEKSEKIKEEITSLGIIEK